MAQYNFKLAGSDFKKGYIVVLDGKIINIQPN
jgi:hypothetical protein